MPTFDVHGKMAINDVGFFVEEGIQKSVEAVLGSKVVAEVVIAGSQIEME